MATREEVFRSASAQSLPGSLHASTLKTSDDLDEDEAMMRDLHDAGILNDEELALMQGTGSLNMDSLLERPKETAMVSGKEEGEGLGDGDDDLMGNADIVGDDELMMNADIVGDVDEVEADLSMSDSALRIPLRPPPNRAAGQEMTSNDLEGSELVVDEEEHDEEEELHVIKAGEEEERWDDGLQVFDDDDLDLTALLHGGHAEEGDEEEQQEEEQGDEQEVGNHVYQHESNKPRYRVGKQTLSVAEALLFGLLDEEGNLKLRSPSPDHRAAHAIRHTHRLAKPRKALILERNEEEEENLTFHPRRSAAAMAAMKNKRCGYDFMDRLNNRGDFLDRITPDIGKKKKLPESEYDALKQDYDAKLDKLQCPQCLKPQSFDEHLENRRFCSACNCKFEKINVTSGANFLKKVKRKELERVERLRAVEREMYGTATQSTIVNKLNGKMLRTDTKVVALPAIHKSIACPKPPSSSSAGAVQTNSSKLPDVAPPSAPSAPPSNNSISNIGKRMTQAILSDKERANPSVAKSVEIKSIPAPPETKTNSQQRDSSRKEKLNSVSAGESKRRMEEKLQKLVQV
eukprot:gene1973-2153_t